MLTGSAGGGAGWILPTGTIFGAQSGASSSGTDEEELLLSSSEQVTAAT